MTTTINDIMRKKLETIETTSSVQQAAKKMKDKSISSLVVVDENGKSLGIVSERDLVTKVCIDDIRTSTVTNADIMSSPLITIKSRASPSEAADMMLLHNVRHLLVVDDDSGDNNMGSDSSNNNNYAGIPVGIITPLDFTRYHGNIDNKDKDAIEKILEYYR
jgi:CBS domain-containing protein